MSKEINNESICLWCGKPTNKNKHTESAEHIFPKSMGGKKTLPVGYVCKDCNKSFGQTLDSTFKYGHEAMMMAFQSDSDINGRIRSQKDKERKLREKTFIEGKDNIKDTKIKKDGKNMYLINANFEGKSKVFVRSLHKYTANILCNLYGQAVTREKYESLLQFVKDGGDWQPWSYAVSYPSPHFHPLISEPRLLIFSVNQGNIRIISFIHTSGIWITGAYPFQLNAQTIETLSNEIAEKIAHIINPDTQKSIINYFGWNWDFDNRTSFGKLKFKWITKETKPKASDVKNTAT